MSLAGAKGATSSWWVGGGVGVEGLGLEEAAIRCLFLARRLAAILSAAGSRWSVWAGLGADGVGVGKGLGGSHWSVWTDPYVGEGVGGARGFRWSGRAGLGVAGVVGGLGEGLGWVEGLVRLLLGLRSFLVWGVRSVGLEGVGTLVCVPEEGFGGDGR